MKKINIIIRREIKIYLFNNYLFFILGVASILGIIITSNTSLKVISLLIFCSFFSHSFYYLYNLPKRLKMFLSQMNSPPALGLARTQLSL
mgnify:CR=1 FL=1